MNRRNYQKELDRILDEIKAEGLFYGADNPDKKAPALFLHSCCAPCSSYVLEYLREFFLITVFYYNPNITAWVEYQKRVEEQKRLIALFNNQGGGYPVLVVEGDYEPELFLERTRGLEKCQEGGERCFLCYELRLRETARRAALGEYDYFATTLTISPLKNAEKLNVVGEQMALEYGVRHLPSDFKKRNGYKRSVELSAKYGLYRQDYCGCAYSKAQREQE